MLKWCSYCQQFQGEVPAFDDLTVTHGMCASCGDKGIDLTDSEIAHARRLHSIQKRLVTAGQSGNVAAAVDAIEDADEANVRPVDVLMGLLAPLLYEIGERWKSAAMSVADEHRFTGFCEEVFEAVWARTRSAATAHSQAAPPEALLVNAYGNYHSLAIRILALWLTSRSVRARMVFPTPSPPLLLEMIGEIKPRLLLVSVALAEHRRGAVRIAEFIAPMPDSEKPRLIVGGNAVRLEMVAPIPGAELMRDISRL